MKESGKTEKVKKGRRVLVAVLAALGMAALMMMGGGCSKKGPEPVSSVSIVNSWKVTSHQFQGEELPLKSQRMGKIRKWLIPL